MGFLDNVSLMSFFGDINVIVQKYYVCCITSCVSINVFLICIFEVSHEKRLVKTAKFEIISSILRKKMLCLLGLVFGFSEKYGML